MVERVAESKFSGLFFMENFPEIKLFPSIDRLERVAKHIGKIAWHVLTAPHQLASHGDHFVNPHESIPFEEEPEYKQESLWE